MLRNVVKFQTNKFKRQAYQCGAEYLEDLSEERFKVLTLNHLKKVKRIGASTAGLIMDFKLTGKSEKYDSYKFIYDESQKEVASLTNKNYFNKEGQMAAKKKVVKKKVVKKKAVNNSSPAKKVVKKVVKKAATKVVKKAVKKEAPVPEVAPKVAPKKRAPRKPKHKVGDAISVDVSKVSQIYNAEVLQELGKALLVRMSYGDIFVIEGAAIVGGPIDQSLEGLNPEYADIIDKSLLSTDEEEEETEGLEEQTEPEEVEEEEESPEEAEEEEEEEEEVEVEEEEEDAVDLDAMDRAELKAFIISEGYDIKVYKSTTDEELRSKIAEAFGEDDAEVEEEEEAEEEVEVAAESAEESDDEDLFA